MGTRHTDAPLSTYAKEAVLNRPRILIVDKCSKQRASLAQSLNNFDLTEASTLQEAETEITGSDAVLVRPERVSDVVQKALRCGELAREIRSLRRRLREGSSSRSLVGTSNAIQHIRERVRLVAGTRAPVVVTGESGTGKEIVAREIHRLSERGDGPFILINCAAVPGPVLDRELFGRSEEGKFDAASGGSLVIDEIGDMPLEIQAKLLGVLQSGHIPGEGSEEGVAIDARLIATTSEALPALVQRGSFRQDLFYRLNVVPIALPPLRERREDIPLLVHHFIDQFSQSTDKDPVRLTDGAMRLLCEADWQGNVRELENMVERLVILAPGATLDEDYFEFDDDRTGRLATMERTFRHGSIRDMERLMIVHRLGANEQNRTHAAKTLKISVRTLRNKLREYRETETLRP